MSLGLEFLLSGVHTRAVCSVAIPAFRGHVLTFSIHIVSFFRVYCLCMSLRQQCFSREFGHVAAFLYR